MSARSRRGMTKDEFKAMLRSRENDAMAKHRWRDDHIAHSRPSATPSPGNIHSDPYWKPFFDGYPPVHKWLAERSPTSPSSSTTTMAQLLPRQDADLRHRRRVRICEPGRGLGHPDDRHRSRAIRQLSWHIIDALVDDEFDVCSCQEMAGRSRLHRADAAVLGRPDQTPIKTIPICINTVQHPVPSPMRCYRLGQSIGSAIASFPGNGKS